MQKNDIESELSYAYLHAVAAQAGMGCKPGNRIDDASGDDAYVTYRGPLEHPYLKEIQINVQLKSTFQDSGNYPDHYTFWLEELAHYDRLRNNDSHNAKVMVVLFLPKDVAGWLKCSHEELVLKRAAYWVNLYGAKEATSKTGATIYLPKANLLTSESLQKIVQYSASNNFPMYSKPQRHGKD